MNFVESFKLSRTQFKKFTISCINSSVYEKQLVHWRWGRRVCILTDTSLNLFTLVFINNSTELYYRLYEYMALSRGISIQFVSYLIFPFTNPGFYYIHMSTDKVLFKRALHTPSGVCHQCDLKSLDSLKHVIRYESA